MKALLIESRDGRRSAIILLSSGKLELGAGGPASIIIELDGENLRVWILSASDLTSFKVIKEIEVGDRLLIEALEYRDARAKFEQVKVKFENKLYNEMINPSCDTFSFLDLGSLAL